MRAPSAVLLYRCSLNRIVAGSVGFLLLAASGLKLYGLRTGPVSPQAIFGTTVFQVGLIEFEVFLGLWLLWGKQPIGAWGLAVVGFCGFAGVSFYQGLLGQASCGCFGKLLVNPWVAFGIDLAVLVALLVGRPELASVWASPLAALRRLTIVMGTGLTCLGTVALLLFALAQFRFGSADAALAALRGESIFVRPFLLDVGIGEPGEERETVLSVVNHSEDVVHIVGRSSNCSCVAAMDLPVSIPAHESRSITVKIRLPTRTGIFTRQVQLWTDSEKDRRLRFSLTGRTIAPVKAPAKTTTE
jgi:hypothetical protein